MIRSMITLTSLCISSFKIDKSITIFAEQKNLLYIHTHNI